MADLLELSLDHLSAGFRVGDFTPSDYLTAIQRQIADVDPGIHAFLHVDSSAARESAANSGGRGALAGIPFAAKDNIVALDGPTTCGSRMLEGFHSPYDATAIERLKKAGGLLVGKCNLDEFAMGSSTEHSAFGPTRNPWDITRVPGGSSGGSAAAVAARMVPFALGSETGGSVRQPASLCGVLGLKPTYGRISRRGLVAFSSSLDQIGIVTRTASDCAHVLSAIAGHDAQDSTSSTRPVDEYLRGIGDGVGGLRVGVVADSLTGLPASTRDNFDSALAVLRNGGARVVEILMPTLGQAIAVYYIIANAEASANLARFDGVRFGHRSSQAVDLKDLYLSSRGEGFGSEVKRRIMLGTFALSSGYHEAYYGRAQKIRSMMCGDFRRAFEQVDVLASPTTPSGAFRVGEKVGDPLEMYLSDVFTAPANLVGVPALTVPSGFDPQGLPLGFQLTGSHFSERLLLRAAHFFENETLFGRRRPPAADRINRPLP